MKYFLCSKSATGQVFCYCYCYCSWSCCCLCFSFYFIVHTHTQKTIENNKVNQQIPFQSENILILMNSADDLHSMCRWSKRTNILREREIERWVVGNRGWVEAVIDDTRAQVKCNIHWFSIEPGKNKYIAENSKGNIHNRFSQNTITYCCVEMNNCCKLYTYIAKVINNNNITNI